MFRASYKLDLPASMFLAVREAVLHFGAARTDP
jgi:hypothetical protein